MLQRKRYLTLVELLVIIAILAILWSMVPFSSGPSREKARRISCTSNLKQIGLAVAQYATDYEGLLPPENGAPGFEVLRNSGSLTDYACYACPSTTTKPGRGEETLTESNVDYLFYGGGKLGEGSRHADAILGMDKPGNHSRYYNTLFCGGHVTGKVGGK